VNQFTKKRKAKGPPLWSLGRAGEMFKDEEAKITLQRKPKGPTNIDILNVGDECNQNCRQCYYKSEPNLTGISPTGEMEFIEKVLYNYTESSIFYYPKESTNNRDLLPIMEKYGQKKVLSNGKEIDDEFIRELNKYGIEEIEITLFANLEQHYDFNRNTIREYQKIKQNIRKCAESGLKVTINNILDKTTMYSINSLCEQCYELGVKKIEFIRLKPAGNAKCMDRSRLLEEKDMDIIIPSVEAMKLKYPDLYLSFDIGFGPNFSGKTLEEAKEKVRRAKQSWVKSPYLCPAINQQYWGISPKSGNVYWCFFLISEPEIARIGYVNIKNGRVTIDSPADLSEETLRKKLKGNCSSESCKYQDVCLGGCRSTAYIFARLNGDSDPFYAGMDICQTKSYERLYGQRGVKASLDSISDSDPKRIRG
jgi:radical SAM protein with 4Fe4S-binding SPASM domain